MDDDLKIMFDGRDAKISSVSFDDDKLIYYNPLSPTHRMIIGALCVDTFKKYIPNRFHMFMQRLFLGIKYEKIESR